MQDNSIYLQDDRLSAIESVLFVSTDIVKVNLLKKIFKCEVSEIIECLNILKKRYEAMNSGIVLKELADGWRLYSNPKHHEIIEKYLITLDPRKLSAAALETLSIIAYCQPVTRAGVASVRGVNSDSSINSLVDKGFVCEAGLSKNAGNAILYKTTTKFLENYGLNSLEELPKIETFAPDTKTKKFIFDKLGVIKEYEVIENPKKINTNDTQDEKFNQISIFEDDSNAKDSNSTKENYDQNISDTFSDALSQAFGLTDKVNLDNLKLNIDDE